MDYSDIRYVKKRVITCILAAFAIFLITGAISYVFMQIHMILRWLSIIAVGLLCCNAWASIVAYNASIQYKRKLSCLENDIRDLKKKLK